jgi:hypothetical protein
MFNLFAKEVDKSQGVDLISMCRLFSQNGSVEPKFHSLPEFQLPQPHHPTVVWQEDGVGTCQWGVVVDMREDGGWVPVFGNS